jgi:hypothetical protein
MLVQFFSDNDAVSRVTGETVETVTNDNVDILISGKFS